MDAIHVGYSYQFDTSSANLRGFGNATMIDISVIDLAGVYHATATRSN